MSLITINGNSLDPVGHAPVIRSLGLEAQDASKSDYILIQTSAPFSPEQNQQLEVLGIDIQSYVSENTYLCGYKDTDLAAVRALPFIAWANVYLKEFKVASDLKQRTTSSLSALRLEDDETASRARKTVDICFHDDVDPSADSVKAAIVAAAHVDETTLEMGEHKVRLEVQERNLSNLASIDAVRAIQQVHKATLFNNKALSILNAHVVINATEFKGHNQVIAVADTGFDEGKTKSRHPAFQNTHVAKLYGLGRAGRTDDPDGHGTHVCGSVLGSGVSKVTGDVIEGVAPQATLVVQSVLDKRGGLGGIPMDLTKLFAPPYLNDGARVHTNSWGSQSDDVQLPYDQSSREIDTFVWNNPDMVIVFAAGNDGKDASRDGITDPAQIGSQAAAKNCITVGASENDRPDLDLTYKSFGFRVQPIMNDRLSNNPAGVAAFSSRGPTKENRIKPDIVAPGSIILSAHSFKAPPDTTFGVYPDPDWFYEAGTSMAAPLVAGCVAVIRETLVAHDVPKPTAALIKALLMNGAKDLAGQYIPSETGPSPNNSCGFGLVDLTNSIILPGSQDDAGFLEGRPLTQGEKETFTINIPDDLQGARDLKVTLVWSDPPGADLQNDLDLIVIAADDVERHGNVGASLGFDRANNVEQISWARVPPGPARVVVHAFRITKFAQPFAVAWKF